MASLPSAIDPEAPAVRLEQPGSGGIRARRRKEGMSPRRRPRKTFCSSGCSDSILHC